MAESPPRSAYWGAPALLVLGTGASAVAGAIASPGAADFYRQLAKPTWAPPARVFGPLWPAITLYAGQLVLNALWTWLFFRWCLVRTFWSARQLAGVLLLPYLLWVTFTAALTYAVWQRNPDVL